MTNKIFFPFKIYKEYLTSLKGIKLTYREVDIISCMLNMKFSHIPAFLLINPRGLESHSRNIRKKLGNLKNKEELIKLIKTDKRFFILKEDYFLNLKIRIFFEKQLATFYKNLLSNKNICFQSFGLIYRKVDEEKNPLVFF